MPNLFSAFTLRGVVIPNRVTVSPMCEYSSEDGFSNDWHFVHLGSRAVGGAGLVFTEAAAVTPEGRISPQDLGIWKDQHVEGLARIVRFVEEQGSIAGIQLAHAGRKASTYPPGTGHGAVPEQQGGWRPVAPSPIRFAENYPQPSDLDLDGISKVIDAFQAAARRSYAAGFRVAEIHSAHGYLLHQFLSPLSNRREDAYGGSFDNRTRLLREVVVAVRAVWPESCPVFVRISATDWTPGGWGIDESVALSRVLKGLGIDLIDCSSGGNVPRAEIPLGSGYQTPFAARIRQEAGICTGAVGMITSPAQADHIIQTGQADLVMIAREFLRDPYWPMRAARELGYAMSWPKQYLRAGPESSPARVSTKSPT
jgi:2,4-dienoyl-CoA reductase-like NADH-dependent reductase (Old Yellow Enzyme family)